MVWLKGLVEAKVRFGSGLGQAWFRFCSSLAEGIGSGLVQACSGLVQVSLIFG